MSNKQKNILQIMYADTVSTRLKEFVGFVLMGKHLIKPLKTVKMRLRSVKIAKYTSMASVYFPIVLP